MKEDPKAVFERPKLEARAEGLDEARRQRATRAQPINAAMSNLTVQAAGAAALIGSSPLPSFEVGPMNGREARESGLPLDQGIWAHASTWWVTDKSITTS